MNIHFLDLSEGMFLGEAAVVADSVVLMTALRVLWVFFPQFINLLVIDSYFHHS